MIRYLPRRGISGLVAVNLTLIATLAASAESKHEIVEQDLGEASSGLYSMGPISPDRLHFAWTAKDKDGRWQAWVIDGKRGPEVHEVGGLLLTPDWKHHAYFVTGADGQTRLIQDGREVPMIGKRRMSRMLDDGRLCYLAEENGEHFVVVDGRPGPRFPGAWGLAASGNGKTVAFAAHTKDGGYALVVNGTPRPIDGRLVRFTMTDDGSRLAWSIEKDGGYYAVFDGKTSDQYDEVSYLAIGPKGRRFAFVAVEDKKAFVVLDGRPGPKFDETEYGAIRDLTFSPDGSRLAFELRKANKKRIFVVDGKPGPDFDKLFDFHFTADGKHYLYEASLGEFNLDSKFMMVVDSKPGPAFEAPIDTDTIVVSPAGSRYAYITPTDREHQVVIDGEMSRKFERATGVAFSGDGKHTTYTSRHKDRSVVWVDGKEVVDSVGTKFTNAALNHDGSKLAYVAWKGGDACVRVDGQQGPWYSSVQSPVFHNDGSVEYIACQDTSYLRVKHVPKGGKLPDVQPPPKGDQRSWVVSHQGGDFRTISEAVQQAGAGDRIVVRPGVYRESVMVEKPLQIAGNGPREEIIIHSTNSDCVYIDADGVVLRGLTLRCRAGADADFFAVDVATGKAVLEDCELTSNSLACVGVHGQGVAAEIRKCWIRDGNDAGVFFYERATGTVQQCEIYGCTEAGVAIQGKADPVIRQCNIHHNEEGGVAATKGGRGTLDSCRIYANDGKQVRTDRSSQLTIHGCRIADAMLSIDTVTSNIDGDDDVDPSLKEIVLRFAQPMDTGGWHLAKVSKQKYGQFPEMVGEKPAFYRDDKTFVLRVKLEPGTRYAFGLNAPGNMEFQSTEGIPLEETIYYFLTAKGSDAGGNAPKTELTGFDVGMLVLKFLGSPNQERFLVARKAVIQSKDYKPSSGDIVEISNLLKAENYGEAKSRIVKSMPNLYLSPRVHYYAMLAMEELGDKEAARKEAANHINCRDAILATGNGTKQQPYLVLRITDEHDVLQALKKESPRQALVRDGGKPYDVFTCTDGSEIWFDISSFYGR